MREHEFTFYDIDEYAIMGAEALTRQHDHLNEVRQRIHRSHRDPRQVEDEICYVQREFDIRRQRAEAHALWLEQNPDYVQED